MKMSQLNCSKWNEITVVLFWVQVFSDLIVLVLGFFHFLGGRLAVRFLSALNH
jgi:hypothetical protein